MNAQRAFVLGLLGNVSLAAVKLGVGHVTGSRALTADGWHSLADIGTNGGAWLAHRWGKKPADDDHHYGHGNAEALAGALVGATLVVAGVAVIVSVWRSESVLKEGVSAWVALAVAVLSIVVNLGLAWISLSVGKRERSHGLRALARDNGSDALAGLLVVAGILGSWNGWHWAEPWAGAGIGVLIVWMGAHSLKEGLDVLMERVGDPELRPRIEELARGVEGVRAVRRVRVHPVGGDVLADLAIQIDGETSVADGHELAHRVESTITEALAAVREVQVHVEPHAERG